jgi:molecular chaperone GrpE
MSKQQTESNDGNEVEKTASQTENPTENKTGETDAAENVTQASGQDHPTDGGSAPESPAADADAVFEGESDDETLAEWIDSAAGDEKITELEAQSADLAAQLADTRDQLLRKAADFENFRKRMNQEKQNAIEFANQMLLLDIIPIIDDFERALQSAEASAELIALPAGKTLLDGIAMIEKRLTSQLESKWGLKRYDSAGEPFDPNYHEAMMMEKSPDVEEPTVKEDFAKGYTLKDRVIRAAKVKVLMPEDSS